MMATMLSANAIVREKELGTLEQLFMTPVRRSELILGKMGPYIVLTTLEFCFIAFLMWLIFRVPIRGHFITLLMIVLPFVLTMLGAGLWISTKASTREAAGQLAMGTFLPSVFLSGYVFPLDSMPWPLPLCRQPDSRHLDDRRLPQRHPPRRRLERAMASCPRPLDHGLRRPPLQFPPPPKAAVAFSWGGRLASPPQPRPSVAVPDPRSTLNSALFSRRHSALKSPQLVVHNASPTNL
jgi:hypothetical protein